MATLNATLTASTAVIPSEGYRNAVLNTANVAAYYRLGDASGGAVDEKGGSSGTYTGGITRGVAGAILSDADSAITLNGTTGFVDLPSTIAPTSAFSTEAWAFLTSKPASGATVVLAQRDGVGTGRSYMYYNVAGDRFASFIGNAERSSTFTASLSTWYHLVFTFAGGAGGAWQWIINGVLRASGTLTAEASTGTLLIGSNKTFNSAGFFPGRIDEVATYTRALTVAEAATHYYDGRLGPLARALSATRTPSAAPSPSALRATTTKLTSTQASSADRFPARLISLPASQTEATTLARNAFTNLTPTQSSTTSALRSLTGMLSTSTLGAALVRMSAALSLPTTTTGSVATLTKAPGKVSSPTQAQSSSLLRTVGLTRLASGTVQALVVRVVGQALAASTSVVVVITRVTTPIVRSTLSLQATAATVRARLWPLASTQATAPSVSSMTQASLRAAAAAVALSKRSPGIVPRAVVSTTSIVASIFGRTLSTTTLLVPQAMTFISRTCSAIVATVAGRLVAQAHMVRPSSLTLTAVSARALDVRLPRRVVSTTAAVTNVFARTLHAATLLAPDAFKLTSRAFSAAASVVTSRPIVQGQSVNANSRTTTATRARAFARVLTVPQAVTLSALRSVGKHLSAQKGSNAIAARSFDAALTAVEAATSVVARASHYALHTTASPVVSSIGRALKLGLHPVEALTSLANKAVSTSRTVTTQTQQAKLTRQTARTLSGAVGETAVALARSLTGRVLITSQASTASVLRRLNAILHPVQQATASTRRTATRVTLVIEVAIARALRGRFIHLSTQQTSAATIKRFLLKAVSTLSAMVSTSARRSSVAIPVVRPSQAQSVSMRRDLGITEGTWFVVRASIGRGLAATLRALQTTLGLQARGQINVIYDSPPTGPVEARFDPDDLLVLFLEEELGVEVDGDEFEVEWS